MIGKTFEFLAKIMSKNLVIVESPAKAKTISRFLGKDYKVLASMGHVRDLPKSKTGIDTEHDFEPTYSVSPDKKKVVTELNKELAKADKLWIATDEDREGEAIGWHLLQCLKGAKTKFKKSRIVFHEITENAIKSAIEHPRDMDQNIVDAQQARRVLDRLVGYELSPLLWKKIRYGLSAGRVQSVAVRLVVEREREIQAFKPEEYWQIFGEFEKNAGKQDAQKFTAELIKRGEQKVEMKNEKDTTDILEEIKGAKYKVKSVEEKDVSRSPSAPFITSTLQQEASRKLNFPVKKTMMVAQGLYEGVDIGNGHIGLITYMRTDSVNLSEFALTGIRQQIVKEYGEKYALKEPRKFKGRKSAQEAHEAIRPVDITIHPKDVAAKLTKDQAKLYELIWKRAMACQMQEAILSRTTVDIEAEKGSTDTNYVFRANGQVIKFPGFMEVYMEGSDLEEDTDDGDKILPKLEEGEKVDLEKLDHSQHFTKPPARYTEASLVKKLESEGIGRPSTYAPTISTIVARGYIKKEAKALVPTDVAMVVTDMLVENFPEIVDYKFTAELEEKLDKIEEEKTEWVPVIKAFYGPFHKAILEKDKTLKKSDMVNEETDEMCEKCGEKMIVKLGRFGKFLSCSNYPKCKNARPLAKNMGEAVLSGSVSVSEEKLEELVEEGKLTQEQAKQVEEKNEKIAEYEKEFKDKKCEKCGEPMVVKHGRFGAFLGCSAYPKCKNIVSIVISSGVKCPVCKVGQLIERHTKRGGRVFWGCNKYPKCKFATWSKPIEIDKDGTLIVEDKEGNHVPYVDTKEKEEE